jgi:hypothetical protein
VDVGFVVSEDDATSVFFAKVGDLFVDTFGRGLKEGGELWEGISSPECCRLDRRILHLVGRRHGYV